MSLVRFRNSKTVKGLVCLAFFVCFMGVILVSPGKCRLCKSFIPSTSFGRYTRDYNLVKGDSTSTPVATWIGGGDLARLPISNAGLTGLYEPPSDWDGTYDGTLVPGYTLWNGYCAEYPAGTGQYYLFSSGIWVGAICPIIIDQDTVGYEPRVATGAYTPDMSVISPLYLSSQVIPQGEPGAGDYLFVRSGVEPEPYQRRWPYADTASINPRRRAYFGTDEYDLDPGRGDIVSFQDSWAVMGDWIPEEEGSFLWPSFGYDTKGLGIRLEQRTYSWGYGFPIGNFIYLNYKIRNMNDFPLDSVYLGFFMDGDIGPGLLTSQEGPNDDLIGFDRSRNLGYIYDHNGWEPEWISKAGYMGAALCRTPANPGDSAELGMTALSTWERGDQGPEGIVDDEATDHYKYGELVGDSDGEGHAIPQDPDPAIFEIFDKPQDVRFLTCSGPYHTLAPGEEIIVTLSIVVGFTYDEFIANVDSAISFYHKGYVYFDDHPPEVSCYLSSVKPVYATPAEEETLSIYVGDPSGVSSVTAFIETPQGEILDSLDLSIGKGGFCTGTWRALPGVEREYNVSLVAKDGLENTKRVANICGFTTKEFEKMADILVVDDDNYNCPNWGSTRKPYDSYYTDALEANDVAYDLWNIYFYGVPHDTILGKYANGVVIWLTGDKTGLSQEEKDAIQSYLQDAGGNILLSEQEIWPDDLLFFVYNFWVYNRGDVDFSNLWVSGVETDSITMGMRFNLRGGTGAGNQKYPDILEPNTWLGASSILTYEGYLGSETGSAGIKFLGQNYKATYLGFGFEAIDSDSMRNRFMKNAIEWLTKPSGVDQNDEETAIPKTYSLSQNYPNPFNSTTLIRYQLSAISGQQTAVTLKIYNILGQEVRTLVDKRQKGGSYEVVWDGKDRWGTSVSSGIYFCLLKVGDLSFSRKMLLMK